MASRTVEVKSSSSSVCHQPRRGGNHGGSSMLRQLSVGRRLGETRSRADRVGRHRGAGQEARRRWTGHPRSVVGRECSTPMAEETADETPTALLLVCIDLLVCRKSCVLIFTYLFLSDLFVFQFMFVSSFNRLLIKVYHAI